MKKLLTSISVALLAILLCAAFSGCTTNVSGKTFTFSEVEYSTNVKMTEENGIEEKLENEKEEAESYYEGSSITFNDDGTVSYNGENSGLNWEQDGKTVSIYYGEDEYKEVYGEYTVSGSTIYYEVVQSYTYEGVGYTCTFTVIYKK